MKKLKNDRSMKTIKRRLVFDRHQLFALKDVNGNVTINMEEVELRENSTLS